MRNLFRASGIAAAAFAAAAMSGAFTFAPAGRSARITGPAQRASASRPTLSQLAGPALRAGVVRFHSSGATVGTTSHRWGGYVASGKGARFRFARAIFFVPYIDCESTPDSVSDDWVGMDGFTNKIVEMTGVFASCTGKKPEYRVFAVYANHALFPNVRVSPGQAIAASVYYSSATRKFTFRMTDTTNGNHFSRSRRCPPRFTCPRTSAEAITFADAQSPTDHAPLTDFRAESFSGVAITDQAGQRSGFRSASWKTYKDTTVNFSGAVMDQPTALFHGTAFTNYWLRPG